MKKYGLREIATSWLLALILTGFISVIIAPAPITITVSDGMGEIGDLISLPVFMYGSDSVYAFQADVGFNNRINAIDAVKASVMPGDWLIAYKLLSDTIRVAFAGQTALTMNNLVMAIRFEADSVGVSSVCVEMVEINEIDQVDLPAIACGTATVTAKAGDVTFDGSVSVEDAQLILDYVVGKVSLDSLQIVAADLTLDGNITALDSSYILNIVNP